MRAWIIVLLFVCGSAASGLGASAKIIKVLPQFLDLQGRHSISPSLYDRDAYQAKLRRDPKERSALRFAIQWRAKQTVPLKLRVEMRGGKGSEPTQATLESSSAHLAGFSKWTQLALSGEDYTKFGELIAWRATLWEGDKLLSEKKSFLW